MRRFTSNNSEIVYAAIRLRKPYQKDLIDEQFYPKTYRGQRDAANSLLDNLFDFITANSLWGEVGDIEPYDIIITFRDNEGFRHNKAYELTKNFFIKK